MAILPTDQDPTAIDTQPVKKPAMPAASPTAPAAPALPVAGSPVPQLGTQPVGPTTPAPAGGAPALPVAPAQTADPMAFQPPAGAPASATPVGTGTLPVAPAAPPAPTAAPTAAPAPASNPLDAWSASQGQDRYQKGPDGQPMDMAAQTWWGILNSTDPNTKAAYASQLNDPAFVKSIQDAKTAADQNFTYGQTHGGFAMPGYGGLGDGGPNALPLHQQPDGSFTNDAGKPATQGGAATNPAQIAEALASGGASHQVQPPTGPASDTNPSAQPSDNPLQQILNAGGTAPSSSGTPDPRVGAGVQTTPTTPDNALTNSTISVDPGVDRFKIANQQLNDTITNTLDPKFKADSDTIAANSFGAGRGVSGMNRTREGNLASDYGRQKAQLTSDFLNPALTGTIGDAYNNAGIAINQQGFQAGQQKEGFNQAVTAQQLADNERQQAVQEAIAQLVNGSSGDPAQIQLLLASIYGGQSAQNAEAASRLVGSSAGG